MRLAGTVIAAATVVACDGGGGAPDSGAPAPLYPGPCDASIWGVTCAMTYDTQGRQTRSECQNPDDDPLLRRYERTATYGEERLATLTWSTEDSDFGDVHQSWTFDATVVTMTETGHDGGVFSWERTAHYDPSVVFSGHPLDPFQRPVAEDAILDWTEVETNSKDDPPAPQTTQFAYSYSPPAHPENGTRIRTRDDGFEEVDFEYQDGRLIRGGDITFGWDDGRLTSVEHDGDTIDLQYEYDAAGNLITRRHGTMLDDDGWYPNVTTFGYGCWE